MHPAISLVVYALAVARVTRLVNADRITKAPRDAVLRALWLRAYRRLGPAPSEAEVEAVEKPLLVYLIECPWCVSIYVGAGAAGLLAAFGPGSSGLFWPALALALSQATGLLAQLEK